jgi:hypothetical protein
MNISRRKGEVMAKKNMAVFGIYQNLPLAEEAILDLKKNGFRNTDISVLFSENVGNKELALEKHTKAPEGATTGAGTGVVIGGILGWLTSVGTLLMPDFGFVAAGPIVSLLAGAGIVGTIGGVAGALIGVGIPEYEAKRYEGRLKKGGILLSVHTDNNEWKKRAKEILKKTGADDIGVEKEAKTDFAKSEKPTERGASV